MTLELEKWEAVGNAYLIVREHDLPGVIGERQARLLCDRRRGLGADGILIVGPSPVATTRMAIVNPDGSASEACGNGTRMVARRAAGGPGAVTIETAAGVLPATVHDDGTITVQMARARLDGPQYVPTSAPFPHPHRFVSIGNPHVTIEVADVAAFPLATDGRALEHHPWLPERANVEVWRRVAPDAVEMRVWERGVGETDACGSGACAVAVAACLASTGTGAGTVDVRSPGGTLRIAVDDDLSVSMTGPAHRVATIAVSDHLLQELWR